MRYHETNTCIFVGDSASLGKVWHDCLHTIWWEDDLLLGGVRSVGYGGGFGLQHATSTSLVKEQNQMPMGFFILSIFFRIFQIHDYVLKSSRIIFLLIKQ